MLVLFFALRSKNTVPAPELVKDFGIEPPYVIELPVSASVSDKFLKSRIIF